MTGRLCDMGLYPGAIDSSDVSERVHGEAVRLIEASVLTLTLGTRLL